MKRRANIYKHMMSGVSQMLPFVVAGSFLIALAYLLLNTGLGDFTFGTHISISNWLDQIGTIVMMFALPVLSGFIAYSIANRPGLVPGFIGGFLAIVMDSGLIGAIIAGFLSGYFMILIGKGLKHLPKSLNSIKAIFIFPILGTLAIGLLMIGVNYLIKPAASLLQTNLEQMQGWMAVVICVIAGAMMAVDMGGPINKIAYLFGILSIISGTSTVLMAAVMAGGMTPPLGIALATLLFKNKFTNEEIRLGRSNWILGATFVTEGAIPFAEKRPQAVLPAIIVGSSIAGGVVALFETTLLVPHGGIFVIFLMRNWWGFVIAILAGMTITAILMGFGIRDMDQSKTETMKT